MANIPKVKGKYRLDIGWEEGDLYPGSTLGLDVPYAVPPSSNPQDIEEHWKIVSRGDFKDAKPSYYDTSKGIKEGIEEGEIDPSFGHVFGTGTHLPYKTGSLDAITSDHALGLQYDIYEGLSEAIRVLRPGGKLFVRRPTDREEAKEIREWLKAQPVTRVVLRPEPWRSDIPIERREEEGRNWVLRFTKV